MRKLWFLCAISGILLSSVSARAADIILNEYNAVKSDGILKNGGSDTYFGGVTGNGGDWMELVVITDLLDIRGWTVSTTQSGSSDATIVIPNDSVFSALRSGTILTIAENVASDFSYAPAYDANNPNGVGDWWINLQASFSAGDSTHSDFRVTVLDSLNNLVFGPAGEGISPASGIGNDEVFKLEASPSALITPLSPAYKDGTSSSFGSPNIWSQGSNVQDFGPLRSVVPEPSSVVAFSGGLLGLLIRYRKR